MKVFQQQRLGRDNVRLSTNLFRALFSRGSDLSSSLMNRKVVVVGKLVRKDSDVYVEVTGIQEIDRDCR